MTQMLEITISHKYLKIKHLIFNSEIESFKKTRFNTLNIYLKRLEAGSTAIRVVSLCLGYVLKNNEKCTKGNNLRNQRITKQELDKTSAWEEDTKAWHVPSALKIKMTSAVIK